MAETYTHTHTHTHVSDLHRKFLKERTLSPSLLLLLAACGGGGGGGGGGRRPVLGPDDAVFVLSATSTETNFIYESVKEESDGNVRLLIANDSPETDFGLDHYVITLLGPDRGVVNFVYQGDDDYVSFRYNFELAGADAELFEFMPVAGIGQPQRIEADNSLDEPDLVSKEPLDYENPRDKGGDNIYDLIISYSTSNPHYRDFQQTLKLEITDDPDDGQTNVTPDKGPAYSREGDVITVSVEEGDTEIFYMQDVTLKSGLSGIVSNSGIVRGVVDGQDAQDVQVRITDSRANLYDLLIEFVTAPDRARPADSDADNQYEFAFAGVLADVLALEFEVTVVPEMIPEMI